VPAAEDPPIVSGTLLSQEASSKNVRRRSSRSASMGVTWGEVTTVEIERRPAKKRKTGAEETGAKETGAKKTGEEETGELASDENLSLKRRKTK